MLTVIIKNLERIFISLLRTFGEQRIADVAKKVKLDGQDLELNCVNLRDFPQDTETGQAVGNYWLEPESMNQRRIQAQEIRNNAKRIRSQTTEIFRKIKSSNKELFFTINETSSLVV